MVEKGQNQPSNPHDYCEKYYLQDNYLEDRFLLPEYYLEDRFLLPEESAKSQKIKGSNCKEDEEVMSFNKDYTSKKKKTNTRLLVDCYYPARESSSCSSMVDSQDFSSEESVQTRCSTKSRYEKDDTTSSTVVEGEMGSPENAKDKHNGWKNSRKRTLLEDSVTAGAAAAYDLVKSSKRWTARIKHLTQGVEKSAGIDQRCADHHHHHQTEIIKNDAELQTEVNENQNIKPKEYKCTICEASFPSFRALGGHKSSHTVRIKREGANNVAALKKNREINTDNNQELSHQCNTCDKSYRTSKALKMHKRSHYSKNGDDGGGPQDQQSSKSPKRVLDIDLNKPPCPDEETDWMWHLCMI